MAFPDVTFPPKTTHEDLLGKLQRFFVVARQYWLYILETEITDPQDGDILTYDATKKKWVNKAP